MMLEPLISHTGILVTFYLNGQWLYEDIVYVWTVVISEHCLCIDSGYIKTLFMYRQRLYQEIVYV
jgi:hypothetical protein